MTAAGAKAKPAARAAVALKKCPKRKIAPKSPNANALSKASVSGKAVGRKSPSPNAATAPPNEASSEIVDASSPAPLHTTVSASSALSCSSPAKEVKEDGLKHKQGDVERRRKSK